MDEAFDFANLFIATQAGELLYFLIAIGLSLAALLLALDQRNRSQTEPAAMRYVLALMGVVGAWGVLTLGSLYTLLDQQADPAVIIPPLERAVSAVVILLLLWAFLTAESPAAEKERWTHAALGLLIALMMFGYSFTVIQWNQDADTNEFNRHSLGVAWTVIPLLFLVMGSGLLVVRSRLVADIPLKALFMVILLLGHVYTLYQMGADKLSGNLVGVLRLAMIASMSLLPVILYRMVIERFRSVVGEASGWVMTQPNAAPAGKSGGVPILFPTPNPSSYNAHREAISLLKILGMMLEKTTPQDIPMQIVKAVASTFNADVVALLAVNDPTWADPVAAYNFIKEVEISGLGLNLEAQPTLVSAIELNIQCVALPTRNHDELADLLHRLDILETGASGPAYFQPLSKERKVVGILVLAFPYTTRLLSDEERNLLEGLGPIAARLLRIARGALEALPPANLPELTQESERTQKIRVEMQGQLENARQQIQELTGQIATLNQALQRERDKFADIAQAKGDMSITQQIRVWSSERDILSEERQKLVNALQQANTLLASATSDYDGAAYHQMLENLAQEKQFLQQEKQRLERELKDLKGMPTDRLQDVINTLQAEKTRIQQDHDRLKDDIYDAQNQLAALGIEGGLVGFAQLVSHLTEERNRFLSVSKRAMAERDVLQNRLDEIQDHREREEGRTQQIVLLQTELARLAADREGILRQRNALKAERDSLNQQRDEWLTARIKLTEAHEDLRRNLDKTQTALRKAASGTAHATLAAPTDLTSLQRRLDEVEESRSDMEFELLRTRETMRRMEEDLTFLEGRVLELEALPPKNSEDYETAQMVVGLAQDLRTPLTSIIGYNELLLSEGTGILGETQRQFLTRIQVNIENLMQLVENLIRALSIDYGGLLLAPRRINVEDLIDDAITASSAQYREKGLNIHLDVAPELPRMLADRDALQQILTRLLTNAYLASPPNGAVTVTARHDPAFKTEGNLLLNAIYFAIGDQGGGIAPEDYERVFNRHYRAENPLVAGLGDKGAGLSIAKALVTAHGGKIWLETLNGGTTFKIVIPVDHPFGEKELKRGAAVRIIDMFEPAN